MSSEEMDSRNRRILKAYLSGRTVDDVGREFGISPQRVHQIVQKLGAPPRRMSFRGRPR